MINIGEVWNADVWISERAHSSFAAFLFFTWNHNPSSLFPRGFSRPLASRRWAHHQWRPRDETAGISRWNMEVQLGQFVTIRIRVHPVFFAGYGFSVNKSGSGSDLIQYSYFRHVLTLFAESHIFSFLNYFEDFLMII